MLPIAHNFDTCCPRVFCRKNHGGNIQSLPSQVFAPSTREELMAIVEQAVKEGKKVRGKRWKPGRLIAM